MERITRQEDIDDYPIVEKLVEEAFKGEDCSDGKEHILVSKLRKTDSFVKELSLVTEIDGKVVGHILLSSLTLKRTNKDLRILSLAPISILPEFQNRGIGAELIEEAHRRACKLGYHGIIVIGHEDYYPRFEYELLRNYNIKIPFEVPERNAFIHELKHNSLTGIDCEVEYQKEFFE